MAQDSSHDYDTIPGGTWQNSKTELPSRKVAIHFTGSGSEYFRIWIVNLLLSLVTLGLYLPFAKARRLKYFWANTAIDGEALSFHGNPWSMFRGFVLMVVLVGLYTAAGRWSVLGALIAFVALCAVWPALWRSSLRFRLANTAWRGLRMRFEGELLAAYLAFLPIGIPLIASVAVNSLVRQKMQAIRQGHGQVDPGSLGSLGLWSILISLTVLLIAPWVMARIKRYQHGGYGIARQHTKMKLGVWPFYKLALVVVGLWLASLIPLGIVVGITVKIAGPLAYEGGLPVFVVLAYLTMILLLGPFAVTRFQNMLWKNTSSHAVAFDSQLNFKALAWVTTKNLCLTVCTLGLYWPFASVALTRLRVEAVTLTLSGSVDDWTHGAPAAGDGDAVGEVAADFFGFDLGL